VAWTTVNAFQPSAEEKRERDFCRTLYFNECWVPESVAGLGDTYFFYDSLEDVHERYREYCEANGKATKRRSIL
jgi:hypothetical protein